VGTWGEVRCSRAQTERDRDRERPRPRERDQERERPAAEGEIVRKVEKKQKRK
jgi:hypothetical protein